MENIEAKLDDGFLILSIKKGEINTFGTAFIHFLCPNCGEINEYEVNYKIIPSLFEKEKKCTKCGAKYVPKIDVNLEPYVNFINGDNKKE